MICRESLPLFAKKEEVQGKVCVEKHEKQTKNGNAKNPFRIAVSLLIFRADYLFFFVCFALRTGFFCSPIPITTLATPHTRRRIIKKSDRS